MNGATARRAGGRAFLPMVLLAPLLLSAGSVPEGPRPAGAGPAATIRVDPAEHFSEEEMTRWKAYQADRRRHGLVALACLCAFYLGFMVFGLNRRLRFLAERLAARVRAVRARRGSGGAAARLRGLLEVPDRLFGGQEGLVVLFYCLLFILLLRLAFFPYNLYRSYWFATHEGLSTTPFGLWLLDYVKGMLLSSSLLTFMVFGIYGLMARVGKAWWLLLWGGVSAAIFAYVLVAPLRQHLYSTFRPLETGPLRTRLEALAERQGANIKDIVVVDASRRTRAVNAYVHGTGPTQRIVLYDTLLEHFTDREIVMILAHELAHWEEPEGLRPYLLFSLTVLAILFLADRVLRLGSRIPALQYTSPTDVSALPVLLLVFVLVFQLLRPVNLYRKRAEELEADRRSLEIVCDHEAFEQVHVKLARLNRYDVRPHPLVVALFYSHPPFSERLAAARDVTCGNAHGDAPERREPPAS